MSNSEEVVTSAAPSWRKNPQIHGHRQIVDALSSAQKSSKGAPAYSRFINRRAGRHLAAVAYRLRVTPNIVTAISALFSFAAIAVLALVPPSWLSGIAVTAGLVVGYALDSADGQLARLRGGGSTSGEWLDHIVDATKISSLHLATLISAYRFFELDNSEWLLVPIGFAVVGAVAFFAMTLNDQLRRNKVPGRDNLLSRKEGTTSPMRSLAVVATDYGVLCWVYVLLGVPQIFFAVYVFLFVCNAVFLVLALGKWFGDMKELDSAQVTTP